MKFEKFNIFFIMIYFKSVATFFNRLKPDSNPTLHETQIRVF